ncbi:membrane protein YqaA with SNARE-associated domain [Rhizobium sp. SG_E_25_P2]|uniref:YqaA family protein n=1 Tax=Rhizobium sp. SG_E_25_P2 TaxID=2879942 RepID=UPI00247657BE|nr:YqaA family protein [Rhizobium sp. SG_E_25_P2]MDH6268031.1 membrane protein YqaA with SNARE-associated domain [Rhizobium sp. SG_E_25_P2]
MDIAVYGGLFLAAFGAATLLPMQSEALLAGLLISGGHQTMLLIAAASLGNILGSVVNWALGRGIERFGGRRWFPASQAQLDRAALWYNKYGRYSLLLSWVPIIGDPITLIAGVLREPLLPFLILVSIAKLGRYLAVAAIALNWA